MSLKKDVTELKRDELGVFLRDRGIPFASRNKEDRRVLASIAESRNVPLKAPVEDDLQKVVEERKNKFILEDGLIKLPDPVKILVGWEKNYINFPNTSVSDVEDYIKLCAEKHNVPTKGLKSTKEGESLYLSGHVTGVEYHRISPNISYCYIKAIVARQKAQTQAPYSVWTVLQKRTGKVESAYCNCPAGLRGYCKHCVALLHFIVRQIEAGCNKACTSQPQVWHKPHAQGKRVTQPDFVRNLVVKKVTGSFDTTPEEFKKGVKKSRVTFEPRAICYRKEKTLLDFDLDRLEKITNGNCGVLLYSPRNNIEHNAVNPDVENIHIEEEVATVAKTIPVLANEILESKENINQSDFQKELMLKLIDSTTDQSIDYVVHQTSKQAKSQLWFDYRIGRITASIANECSRKVTKNDQVSDKNNSIVAKIFNYKPAPANVKSLKWGRERELSAIIEYEKLSKNKHQNLSVKSTGLHICRENPWLAATPDSLIYCDCCGLGCLEVKNPEKLKNDTITQIASSDLSYLRYSDMGQVSLDKNHQYYSQIQIQMYATNTKHADFVVKTIAINDNIFIERIAYDDRFATNLINKCKVFFKKIIVNELMTNEVKLHYEKLQMTNCNLENTEVAPNLDLSEGNVETHVACSNEAILCPVCRCECKDEPLTLTEESICCTKCEIWYHYPCVGIKGNENVVRSKYRKWFCDSCKNNKMML